jgi:two-component system invasion response regulator UvrY
MVMQGTVKAVLADDHPIVMSGFAMSLADYGIEVIGEARTPEEAIVMYAERAPDVLILDIRFGEKLTGLDAAKEVLKKNPDAKIVFLSQFDQDSLIKETYKIGALAFITKDCDPATLAAAVARVAKGERYFLPEIAERLANLSVRGDNSPRTLLDARELEVFVSMAQGLTNAEMAVHLALSTKTISNISHTIKGKLGIRRVADITLMAVRHGLLEP